VDDCYDAPACPGPRLAFATVCFAFQIYFDFSAYSDIAVGVARLFGIELMRNFAYPYFSQTMTEFWRRWHISLSTWFRDYLYIPLGGSRAGPARRVLNVMATFVLSGLWHGAAWRFVVWGALHGALVAASRGPAAHGGPAGAPPGGEGAVPGPRAALRMGRTFALVSVTWVFFRAETASAALAILRRIVTDAPLPAAWASLATGTAWPAAAIALVVLVEWAQRRRPHPLAVGRWPASLRWLAYTALLWGSLFLAPWEPREFIYFQF
jgi:D-alanyl-lipoteichoic acid acyltransferase DltB (MBOAT superfamily)